MAEVHGTCDQRFDAVRSTLQAQLESGADLGASVAVFHHGEPVVDIWGGWADPDKSSAWERDTITNVWSTTKTMTFVCALMLHDRGELDFDAPVATYWPEFAQAGKEAVWSATSWATPPASPAGRSRSSPSSWPTGICARRCSPRRRRGGSPERAAATTP